MEQEADATASSHVIPPETARNDDVENTNIAVQEIEVLSDHCLICDVDLHKNSSFDVFGQFKGFDSSRTSVFERVGQVLNRNLSSIHLHSDVVCNRCFYLLVEYEETKHRLQVIKLDLVAKFNTTAYKHLEANHEPEKNPSEITNIPTDPNISSNQKVANKPLKLVITEEGKVVDSNGKEKESLRKRIKRRSKENVRSSKSKPYTCSVCGKGFRAFSHRVEHMLIHLGEKPWSCEECSKKFRTKSALRVHILKHSGNRPYSCQQCGKSFLDRYYFEQHRRVHSGERPFICTYCQKPFARKKDLVIHTKSHTGDKPFKCTLCPKTFAVKSRLDRHSRIHSGEKPHHCEYCEKSFIRRDDYKVHVRLHTGERPFICAICGRSFANQSNCLVHVRMHEGSKVRHSCKMCEESFNRRSKLEKHMAANHADISSKQNADPKPQEAMETTVVQNVESVSSEQLQHLTQVQIETIETPPLPHAEAIPQSVIHAETLQGLTVTDLQTLQAIPITQVAQLEWSDGTAGVTTTTYVNLTPGTYVNLIN